MEADTHFSLSPKLSDPINRFIPNLPPPSPPLKSPESQTLPLPCPFNSLKLQVPTPNPSISFHSPLNETYNTQSSVNIKHLTEIDTQTSHRPSPSSHLYNSIDPIPSLSPRLTSHYPFFSIKSPRPSSMHRHSPLATTLPFSPISNPAAVIV